MRKTNLLLAMALTALMFTACNKNDDFSPGTDPESTPSGEVTYATFTFKVDGKTPSSVTRAEMEGEVAADNGTVADLRLLIFDDDAAGKLVTNTVVTTTEKSTTVKTTSGNKRIFVIANAEGGAGIKGKLDGLTTGVSTLTDFYNLMSDGKDDSGVAEMGSQFKELIRDDVLFMSNVADRTSKKTLKDKISADDSQNNKDEAHNNFTFKVYRAVAKGNLTIQLKGNALTTVDKVFTLDPAATFGVRNVNRSALFVQQYSAVDAEKEYNQGNAHTSVDSPRPHAAFYNVFDGKDETFMKDLNNYKPYYYGGYPITGADPGNAAQTVTMNNEGVTAVPSATVYFTENSNNTQVNGNTTYIGIATKVASIPADKLASSIEYDTNMKKFITKPETGDYTNGGTDNFYAIRNIPAELAGAAAGMLTLFKTETVAWQAVYLVMTTLTQPQITTNGITNGATLKAAYDSKKGGDTTALSDEEVEYIETYLATYTGGISYYRLNVYELTDDSNKRNLIRRNHCYNAKVSAFKTIGKPTEEELDKDPEKPVDAEATNVTATIDVQGWANVDTDTEL